MKYDFYDESIPSFVEIERRSASDPTLPKERRASIAHAVSQAVVLAQQCGVRLAALDAMALPFTRDVVEGLIARITEAGALACDPARDQVFQEWRFALVHYDQRRPPKWLPLSPEASRLAALVEGSYLGRNLSRLLVFMTSHELAAADVNDAAMPALLAALRADPSIQHPGNVLLTCIRAWNNASSLVGWPQTRLSTGGEPDGRGVPWSEMATLRGEALAFLEAPRPFLARIKEKPPRKRSAATVGNYMEKLRLCASELVHAEVCAATDLQLRDLVMPANVGVICSRKLKRAGGAVTPYLKKNFELLAIVAREAGILGADEKQATLVLIASYDALHKKHRANNPSRVDRLMKRFVKNPAAIDAVEQRSFAFYDWAHSQMPTRQLGCSAKCAMILAVGLEAPMRPSIWLAWRLDHIVPVLVDGVETVMIHIPASDAPDKKERRYLLSEKVAKLLREYLTIYRGLLYPGNSPYVIPGANEQQLQPTTLCCQFREFIEAELGIEFTPLMIGQIVREIILEENPKLVEVARSTLAHNGTEMCSKVAARKDKRRTQSDYQDAVIGGRLRAKRINIVTME